VEKVAGIMNEIGVPFFTSSVAQVLYQIMALWSFYCIFFPLNFVTPQLPSLLLQTGNQEKFPGIPSPWSQEKHHHDQDHGE
jgi:hypothetical protein